MVTIKELGRKAKKRWYTAYEIFSFNPSLNVNSFDIRARSRVLGVGFRRRYVIGSSCKVAYRLDVIGDMFGDSVMVPEEYDNMTFDFD